MVQTVLLTNGNGNQLTFEKWILASAGMTKKDHLKINVIY
jgi:hypothetical protein